MTYPEIVRDVERILSSLQSCDDVDNAIKLYEEADLKLKRCEEKIEACKGKVETIMQSNTPT